MYPLNGSFMTPIWSPEWTQYGPHLDTPWEGSWHRPWEGPEEGLHPLEGPRWGSLYHGCQVHLWKAPPVCP